MASFVEENKQPPPQPKLIRDDEFVPNTKNGYLLGEVTSALQKSIRRGLEEEAMYWALEMLESGYRDYLWRRLIIITSEDIGIADPFAAILVGQLWENAQVALGKAKKDELNDQVEPLQEAILYMCRTHKTRYGDDFMNYVMKRRSDGWKPEIPDVALDMHTKRGREMGRGAMFFCKEGCKVSPEAKMEGPDYWAKYCSFCPHRNGCSVARSE